MFIEMIGNKQAVLMDSIPKSKSSKMKWFIGATCVVLVVLTAFLLVAWIYKLPCSNARSESTFQKTKRTECSSKQSTFPDRWIKFFHISDIHVDPEYDPNITKATFCHRTNDSSEADYEAPYGRPRCDSPRLLVQNTFHAMNKISMEEGQPDFIIVTGDMSAHDLGTPTGDVVFEAITVATEELYKRFPDTYVFPCLGNNDIPEDYYIPPHPQGWYNAVRKQWRDFVICEDCHWRQEQPPVDEKEFTKTFVFGGYYRAQLAPKLTLLVLNTNYFSRKATVQTKLFIRTAIAQLQWLEDELDKADLNDGKVIISGHIPPGISTHGLTALWFENYTRAYVNLTAARYPHVIGGQLFGHLHRDDFRFFYGDNDEPSLEQSSALILTASLTPIYENNPSFRLVYINDVTKSFIDYRQWYLNLAMANEHRETYWQYEYAFSEAYPSCLGQVINNERIMELSDGIISKSDDHTWLEYIWHRTNMYIPDKDTFSQNLQYCCIRSPTPTELEKCKKAHPFIPG